MNSTCTNGPGYTSPSIRGSWDGAALNVIGPAGIVAIAGDGKRQIGDLGNRTDLPVISGMMGVTFFLGFYGAVIGGIICAMSAKSPMCKLQLVLYVATIFIDILLIMNITIS